MVKPKKHLGQHFLKDDNIAQKIVEAMSSRSVPLVEIGPGTGVLTQYLIERNDFEAWDVDEESVQYLKNTYPEHSDKIKLNDFLKEDIQGAKGIIGNFPYNISSQIFFKIWDHRNQIDEVVGMVQKEVAERIASAHGNKVYGILSVLLQAFYSVEILFTVPPGVFIPPPKVQSAVLKLKRNSVDTLDCDEQFFKRIVKAGFGKRRKTLRNALKDLALPMNTEFEMLNKRAEQLSVQEFIQLTKEVSSWKE